MAEKEEVSAPAAAPAEEQKPEAVTEAPTETTAEAPASETAPTEKQAEEKSEEKSERPQRSGDNKDRLRHDDWREKRDKDNKNKRSSNGQHQKNGPRGRREYQDYTENVRSKYDNLPQTDDPAAIRAQVEFYFSDSNLPADKFLLERVGGPANNAVPIKILHDFKRMRRFQPYSAVVAALKDSTILEVTDDEEVRRKTPLDASFADSVHDNIELFEDKTRPRSIYAKGFSKFIGDESDSTQLDIEKFFSPYGPVKAVRLRRTFPEKKFKGSVFVEFESAELAKDFLALETKPKWNGDVELKILSKEDYVRSKAEDVKHQRIFGSANRGRGGRGGGRGGNRGGRGDRRDGRDDRRDRDRNREKRSRDDAAEANGSVKAEGERSPKKRAAEDDAAPAEAKKTKVDDAE